MHFRRSLQNYHTAFGEMLWFPVVLVWYDIIIGQIKCKANRLAIIVKGKAMCLDGGFLCHGFKQGPPAIVLCSK